MFVIDMPAKINVKIVDAKGAILFSGELLDTTTVLELKQKL